MTAKEQRADARQCYFCKESSPSALDEHHIVPQRYNGSDEPENLVTVCASCHRKLEDLYDDDFYERMGGGEIADNHGGNYAHGREVVPEQSKDRMIPPASPHVCVESLMYFPRMEEPSRKYHDGRGPQNQLAERYPDSYRLHCGYCHTVFSQHQHSDAARHLRITHGIENPYEDADTAFFANPAGDILQNIGDDGHE